MVKPTVKSVEEAGSKWAEETPRRAAYYEKYTPAAASKWEANTTAAATTYKAAVTAPDIDKRFSGGVKRAGAAKFSRKVTAVGVARFGPGVTAAAPDYRERVAPYLEEIAKTDLPERKARGDPANLARVEKIATALHKKRIAAIVAGVTS